MYYRWPPVGRQSTDYRSTIGRQWTDISADSGPINVHISADASADSRSINVYILGDTLVDYIGRLSVYISVDYRSIVGLYVDRGHL